MVLPRQAARAMMRVFIPMVSLGVLVVALSGASCSSSPTSVDGGGVNAVVITLDGLRPDAVTQANMPVLFRIAGEGATTFQAQTVDLTFTLPSHTSMMTGLSPQRHGINWNDDQTGLNERVAFPTMFDVATAHDRTGAMFVGKSKLLTIVHNGSPSRLDLPPVGSTWKSDTVSAHVVKYLGSLKGLKKPDLMWIHLPDTDLAGHAFGWMSPEYIRAARHVDSAVAVLWTSLKGAFGDNLVLIITADHGGFGTNHADGSALDRTTPWIVWGKGVTPQTLTTVARNVDVAPTMLWAIGIDPPADWDGVPLKAAFPKLTR
jgi:predicted AlkP superfamily pyrophosphatase or phosphodiesterase